MSLVFSRSDRPIQVIRCPTCSAMAWMPPSLKFSFGVRSRDRNVDIARFAFLAMRASPIPPAPKQPQQQNGTYCNRQADYIERVKVSINPPRNLLARLCGTVGCVCVVRFQHRHQRSSVGHREGFGLVLCQLDYDGNFGPSRNISKG